MMSVAPIASADGAAGYYSNSDNYYFLGNLQSLWMGEGARELGLEGAVMGDALTAVLEGRLPDGSRLGKEINGNHVHRPGHDLTFSAPKSVSLLILIGGDKQLLEAHNHAVQVAASYIEKLVSARDTRDGITSILPTGKMVAAAFTHDTSRNLDPQVHTHLLVANMTELDGKWKALATDYIHGAGFIETVMKMQVTLGKIYRNTLRDDVEKLGHRVEETGKNGLWEIAGVPEAVREEYSSRGREIEGAVGAEATLRSRDVAAKDTRQAKQDPSRLRLMERWLGQMRDLGFDMKAYQAEARERAPEPDLHTTVAVPEPVSRQQDRPGQTVPRGKDNGVQPGVTLPGSAEPSPRPAGPAVPGQDVPALRQSGEPVPVRGHETAPVTPGRENSSPAVNAPDAPAKAPRSLKDLAPDLSVALQQAISQLSDRQTRFTWGELMLTAMEYSDVMPGVDDLRAGMDAAMHDGLIVPLDAEKGVFTSRIHLLDELSLQSVTRDLVAEGRVVNRVTPRDNVPGRLSPVVTEPVVLFSAPASVPAIRSLAEEIAGVSLSHGRQVQVLASSAERAGSLGKSDMLKDRLISRQQILSGDAGLRPQGTLIVEGAEKLGLKETLLLTAEARTKNTQLIFLDSAGRQANGNAMTVLTEAGVSRSVLSEPVPGLETRVVSIADKRERYAALAERYAELSAGSEPVTAVVKGAREQKNLTGLIRDALQNAGQLARDGVTVETRTPVWLDNKTRRLPSSYRAGQVLEDRTQAKETKHWLIDRVHDDTRYLTLLDTGTGEIHRQKISEMTPDWRLYEREEISVNAGEKMLSLAADKRHGLKAKDRLTVTATGPEGVTFLREGGKGKRDSFTLPADQPLYMTHRYVAAPGSRDNEQGVVLASLNVRDISGRMVNDLARSGDRAEIFTAETLERAETRLGRMRDVDTPVQMVSRLSGQDTVDRAVSTLRDNVMSEARKAVTRAVAEQRNISFSELVLTEAAQKLAGGKGDVRAEIAAQIKSGELIEVVVRGESRLIHHATWEMEKSILSMTEAGKNTRSPLMDNVDPALLAGLTRGQQAASTLILSSTDQFTGVQGYAGVGKTTQVRGVLTALNTLPATVRPEVTGLAPTHRAVKELNDAGVVSQTAKSFLVEHDRQVAAGEKPDYGNRLFLIDESSMVGLQDTAAVYQAIRDGGGRAVSMGDVDQFESVDSGAPFKLLQERSPMDVAIMKEIVRQNDRQLKEAVYDIIENRPEAAISRLQSVSPEKVAREAQGEVPAASVMEVDSPVDAVARDWVGRTPEARAQTIIISQLNADRKAINQAIHDSLVNRHELGSNVATVPVLEKISHTRHQFNRTGAWETGMVMKRGDSYQDVVAVDRNGGLISVRNEGGKLALYSPRELLTGDVELFKRDRMEVREGDELRFTLTARDAGQLGNDRFRVTAVRDSGELELTGKDGTRVINPKAVRHEQHIDYAWAVTGYGAQGASSPFVIALEGTEGGRKQLATMRAFYITASRAKDHVQIYTDKLDKWLGRVKSPETEPKTAHDVLKPETERKQARAIWAMGTPPAKTAIGRTWLRHQAMKDTALTARVIPATRRFPDPALAFPLYDRNGKSAGLSLASLVVSPEGRLTLGDTRMVATQGAQGAVLQRSRNGQTVITRSLEDALAAAKADNRTGVIWQVGDTPLSEWMVKVTRGDVRENNALFQTTDTQDIRIPREENHQDKEDLSRRSDVVRSQRMEEQQRADLAARKATPEENQTAPVEVNNPPDATTLRRIAGEEAAGGDMPLPRVSVPEQEQALRDKEAASQVRADMLNEQTGRAILSVREQNLPDRTIEHDEPAHTRTIQKER